MEERNILCFIPEFVPGSIGSAYTYSGPLSKGRESEHHFWGFPQEILSWSQSVPNIMEYWMIGRVPGFSLVVKFGSSLNPFPLSHCLSFSVFSALLFVADRVYWWEGRRGWARIQITRLWKSLTIYKSFNTFWVGIFTTVNILQNTFKNNWHI